MRPERFEQWVDRQVRSLQMGHSDGYPFDWPAVIATPRREWAIDPKPGETVGDFIVAVSQECKQSDATWVFIAKCEEVAIYYPDDPRENRAVNEIGSERLRSGLYLYARDLSRGLRLHGAAGIEPDGRMGDAKMVDNDQQSPFDTHFG